MTILETGRKVLELEAAAISRAVERLDENFSRAIEILHASRGRVVITGMGKSGLIGRKIAATMTSTGTPAVFLHPAEALHGDIGIINPEDCVIAISSSGETDEVVRLLNYIKRLQIKLVALVGNPCSTLARQSDVFIDCSVEQEACSIGLIPSTSSTLTLAVGDAISIALIEKKGFTESDFHRFHPGGSIGKKLLKVKHLMHTGSELPTVDIGLPMVEVIAVIDSRRFGLAIVTEGDRVAGVITDGDLRRLLLRGLDFSRVRAADCLTFNPKWVGPESLAVEALSVLEENAITSVLVMDENEKLVGLLHLHDLWRTEMI